MSVTSGATVTIQSSQLVGVLGSVSLPSTGLMSVQIKDRVRSGTSFPDFHGALWDANEALHWPSL